MNKKALFVPAANPIRHYENFHCDVLSNQLLLLGSQDLVKSVQARTHLYDVLKCTNILNAANDVRGAEDDERFNVLRVNAVDVQGYDMSAAFEQSSNFIHAAVSTGTAVYVHCQEGVSRSVTLVLAYLIGRCRMSLNDAFDVVKKVRIFAQPNLNFWQQLMVLEVQVHGGVSSCGCRKYIINKLGYTEQIAQRLLRGFESEEDGGDVEKVEDEGDGETAEEVTVAAAVAVTEVKLSVAPSHGANVATSHGKNMGPNQILDSGALWLGPAPVGNSETMQILHDAGVTHVVNCTKDAPFFPSVVQCRVSVDDEPTADISSQLIRAVDFVQKAIEHGGIVYVHCEMGVSRSSTVVIAYRMVALHETLREAYDRTKECRAVISPNKGFFAVLVELEMKHNDGKSTMTFDDFYTVAKMKEELTPYIEMGLIDEQQITEALTAANGNIERARAALEERIREALF